jgi:hypothetical protein
LNGYNNGNAVSATANGSSIVTVNHMQQQPVRVQNGIPTQHHLNGGTHMNGQMNGHHVVQQQVQQQQVPIRTPVPPAPAPSQPAPVSSAPPPAPRTLILRGFQILTYNFLCI